MKDILDVHNHTTASGHAYSTLNEIITTAEEKKLKLVGIADHAPRMPGSANELYFLNFKVIDRNIYKIRLLMGVELNIMDYSGNIDLSERILDQVDYAIASLHTPCIKSGTIAENTEAIIGAMRKPNVVIIGHPDNPAYSVDFDLVARAAKDNHVLLEVNNSSYNDDGIRVGSRERAKLMLSACKRNSTPIIMGSDAHIKFDVGDHKRAQEILAESDFPSELVVNSDVEYFLRFVNFKRSLRKRDRRI